MEDHPRRPRRNLIPHRRGGIYVAVLGISSLLAVVSIAGIAAARLNARVLTADAERAEARSIAVSAVDLGRLLVAQEADWRTKRADGLWLSSNGLGSSTMTLDVSDPLDNDINNRPHDPVVLRGTGVYGDATQLVELSLVALPKPLPVLSYPLHTPGGVTVGSGAMLRLSGGTLSSEGTVTNSGTIDGNLLAAVLVNLGGTVTGTTTLLAPALTLPPASVVDLYADMATEISTSELKGTTLAPGLNPWGSPNPDGLYVVRTNGNVDIENCRLHGTLVVICPGKRVKVASNVILEPARADYPTLILDGDASFEFQGGAGLLEESVQSCNFNPAGAPYLGESDADISDTYTSAIRGLVHVTGRVSIRNSSVLAGAVLCTSTALTDAVTIADSPSLIHDPALLATPPQGYSTVTFTPGPDGWRQVVR